MARHTIEVTIYDEDDDEHVHELPAKMEVCGRCDGHGTHLREGMEGHAYTSEEFEQEFDDEMREEYFKRGGIYDQVCGDCHGKNVVAVIDEDAVRRMSGGPEILAALEERDEARARDNAEAAYERRWCG